MKKKLSILLSLALVFSLTACGGDAKSSSTADDSQLTGNVVSQDWPIELIVPSQDVERIQWSSDYSTVEITLDKEWTAEAAQAYGAQCVDAGFEMWESGEIENGTYFNEGLSAEGTSIVSIAFGGEEDWNIRLIYVNS